MTKGSISRAALIRALVEGTGLSRSDSALILEEVLNEIAGCLAKGEPVKINRFATFSVRHKKQRMGRNILTGEEVPILPRRVVKFRPSENLKFKVNQPD
jgi:integration host factor subunit alpha